jgi:hypothetical protein
MNHKRDTWEDPIVNEVRAAREELAKKFNYDIGAIFKHLRVMEEAGRKNGRVYADRPPKLLESKRTGTAD